MTAFAFTPQANAQRLDHRGDDPARARDALHALDSGCPREEWVRLAMAAKAAGLDADDFVAWSRGAPNYKSEADCRAVWRSLSADGKVGAGTLFAAARAAGWTDRPSGTSALSPRMASRAKDAPAAAQNGAQRPAFDVAGAWASAEPATPAHPYIARKLGLPDGLRVYRGPLRVAGQPLDGALLVPAFDATGELVTWQAVPADADAKKLNAPGRSVAGCFVVGGAVRDGEPLYVCEGIGAAWSAHQATGKPAAVAFGAQRMEAVALDLHERHPTARLVLVADVGKELDAERIAGMVGGSWVAAPADLGGNGDVNDLHQRDGLQAVSALLASAHAGKPAPGRFRLLSADDLASLPPVRWRVRGVLPEQGLAAVYGPSGAGKSFLVLDLLGAVADGREWFGRRSRACPVTYLALEGEAGIAQRVAAYRVRHGHPPAAMRFVAAPFALLEAGDVLDLAADIRATGGADGIVVIDTLNRAANGADENDSRDMGRLIAGAKALQAALGGLVVLVHHSGKDASRGLRGHSSLHGALDAVLEVSRDGERREWRLAKSKDGTDGEAYPFRLAVVELGTDDDGELVTSAVVQPVAPDAESVKPQLPNGGTNQRVAWDVLGPMFRAAGVARPEGVPENVPAGRPVVTMDAALDAIGARLVVPKKRRRERATQALRGLAEQGLLCHEDGWLWCA
jgi:hypothetical protein